MKQQIGLFSHGSITMNQSNLRKIAKQTLIELGENPNRVGLKDTPKRIAKMWVEIFKGYDSSKMPKITVFPNNDDGIVYDEIIIDKGKFYSHCEHHMATIYGNYYFGYIPNKHLIGLSKIARVIDYFGSRLQIQERLGNDVVNYLEQKLKPKGIILILKARHMCKEMRGVKKEGEMITSIVKGLFKKNQPAREEFLSLINL